MKLKPGDLVKVIGLAPSQTLWRLRNDPFPSYQTERQRHSGSFTWRDVGLVISVRQVSVPQGVLNDLEALVITPTGLGWIRCSLLERT